MDTIRTRRGKIARLPREIREEVNRRLADGEPGRKLAQWLNELPEVRAVLAAQFGGQPITESNLTNWRQGGYAQWRAHREASATLERSLANARQLEGGNAASLADRLSLWVMSRLLVANDTETAEGAREKEWRRLRQLSRDVARLRRNDQGAGWLRLQHERLAGEHIEQEKKLEEEFLKWAKDPAFLETICRRFLDHPDKLALLRQAMFGGPEEAEARQIGTTVGRGGDGWEGSPLPTVRPPADDGAHGVSLSQNLRTILNELAGGKSERHGSTDHS